MNASNNADDSNCDDKKGKRKKNDLDKTRCPPSKRCRTDLQDDVPWTFPEKLAENLDTSLDTCKQIVNLLDNNNTIPFIARYRKEQTGNMDASKLRDFAQCYDDLKVVRVKVDTVIKTLSKEGKITDDLTRSLNAVTSLEEFEHLYQPFKKSKTTLAGKARSVGLEPMALRILEKPSNKSLDELFKYVNTSKQDLKSISVVEDGVKHIIAEMIAKHYKVLNFVKENFQPCILKLESKESRNSVAKRKAIKGTENVHKFENYYNFKRTVGDLKSHQILAINRGESLKMLSVKIYIPSHLSNAYSRFALDTICKVNLVRDSYPWNIVHSSIEESYTRFIQPLVTRRTRSQLTKKAEISAVSVFAKNLRNLLLTPPVRGKVVMGIDPGFTKGCKIAVISSIGDILHTSTLNLHTGHSSHKEQDSLADIINTFRCDIIGIGNGTACRETEAVVSGLIKDRRLHSKNLVFCIVNESGISIYSVTDEATSELPQLEPNLRSAVALARRVMDPLSEYVKVEPKHLGVGMYQHDVSETVLKKMLDNVVEDCVNEVGVEINTCNVFILSKVAGLSKSKAENIIAWKNRNGLFSNREQLKLVHGIGRVTFEQCAGFLRIENKNSELQQFVSKSNFSKFSKIEKVKLDDSCSTFNVLDRTIIHPESYKEVSKLLNFLGLNSKDIGSAKFIDTVKIFVNEKKVSDVAQQLNIGLPTLNIILEGLQKCSDFDIRTEYSGPLFKTSIRDMKSLRSGSTLTGKVMNVTDFGAFVDVGVGTDGLIHRSRMRIGTKTITLSIGDVIEVSVLEVDCHKKRISLNPISLAK